MDWDASGNSVRDAINQLVGKSSAIRDVSYKAGRLYGQRITPSWYRVTRIYYKKAKRNPDLEEGARWMEANNWENAIESLEKAVENGDRKSRGMAAHNLAVVYEILRNLENARDWAQKAWAQYENRDSKDYAYQLNRRIQEGERLKYQMGE
jgi:tetratricopeptide (TPR) repeat protein